LIFVTPYFFGLVVVSQDIETKGILMKDKIASCEELGSGGLQQIWRFRHTYWSMCVQYVLNNFAVMWLASLDACYLQLASSALCIWGSFRQKESFVLTKSTLGSKIKWGWTSTDTLSWSVTFFSSSWYCSVAGVGPWVGALGGGQDVLYELLCLLSYTPKPL